MIIIDTDGALQRCGQSLYDDFVEQRPGAAIQLAETLNGYTQHAPAFGEGQSSRGVSDRWSSPTLQNSGTLDKKRGIIGRQSVRTNLETYDPRPKGAEQVTTVINCDPESRWLLVCAKARERPPSLSQLDICSTATDQELFESLRRSYLELKSRWSRWFPLRRVQSIRFVQVGLRL